MFKLIKAFFISSALAICGAQEVDLHVNMTAPLATLKCVVPRAMGPFKLSLFCPLVESVIDATDGRRIDMHCFQGCKASCRYLANDCVTQETLNTVNCTETIIDDNLVLIYKVNTLIASMAGRWYCKYRNQQSASIFLNVYEPPKLSLPSFIVTPSSISDTRSTIAPTSSHPAESKTTSFTVNVERSSGVAKYPFLRFFRAEYIIAALCFVGISIIINLAFFIRCIMAKCYIAYKRQNHSAPGCLAKCLCVSTIEVDHCDSLYEEMDKPSISALPSNRSNITRSTIVGDDSFDGSVLRNGLRGVTLTRSQTMPTVGSSSISSYPVYQRPVSNKYFYMQSTDPGSGEQFMQRVLVYDEVPIPSEAGDSDHGSEIILSQANTPNIQEQRQHIQQLQRLRACSPMINEAHMEKFSDVRSVSPAPGGPTTQQLVGYHGGNGTTSLKRHVSGSSAHRGGMEPGIPEEIPFLDGKINLDERSDDLSSTGGGDSGAKNSTRLELSRMMLKKADTLLREANTLLLPEQA